MKWFMNYIALGEAQVEHNLKICVPGWKTFTTDSHDVWSHSLRDQILSDSSEPLVALVSTCGHLKMRLHLIRAYLGLVSAIYCLYSLRGRQLPCSQRFSSAARRQERRERSEFLLAASFSLFSPRQFSLRLSPFRGSSLRKPLALREVVSRLTTSLCWRTVYDLPNSLICG